MTLTQLFAKLAAFKALVLKDSISPLYLGSLLEEMTDQLQQHIGDVDQEAELRQAADNSLSSRIDSESTTRKNADDTLKKSVDYIQGTIELEELDNMYGPALVLKKYAMEGNGPFRFIATINGRNVGSVDVIGDGMGHNLTQILTTHYVAPEFNMHTDETVHTYIRTYVLSKGSLPEPQGTWTEWREPYAEHSDQNETVPGKGGILKQKTLITEDTYQSFLTSVEYIDGLSREELDLTKTGTWLEIKSLPQLILKGQMHLPAIKAGTDYSDSYRDYVRQFAGTELVIYNSSDKPLTVYPGADSILIPKGSAVLLRLVYSPEKLTGDGFLRETIKWEYTDPFLF